MEDYFSQKAVIKSQTDLVLFGTSILLEKKRSRFNPLRYLMGEQKIVRINPCKTILNFRKYK